MRAVTSSIAAMRHAFGAAAEGLLVAALIATLVMAFAPVYAPADWFAGDAAAGRLTGTLTIPDGELGGTTTATANPGGDNAWVRVRCYNDGGVALESRVRVDGANEATIHLGPTPSWTSGGATCEAWEGYYARNGAFKILAYTTFDVAG